MNSKRYAVKGPVFVAWDVPLGSRDRSTIVVLELVPRPLVRLSGDKLVRRPPDDGHEAASKVFLLDPGWERVAPEGPEVRVQLASSFRIADGIGRPAFTNPENDLPSFIIDAILVVQKPVAAPFPRCLQGSTCLRRGLILANRGLTPVGDARTRFRIPSFR